MFPELAELNPDAARITALPIGYYHVPVRIRMNYYQRSRLRFHCTGCGECCSGGPDYYVFVSARESERIRCHLELTPGWFNRRYVRRTPAGEQVINNQGGGRCVFLGKDNRCRIYAVRPLQCRTYPFWPEVVKSRASWRQEARRCEGMDQGRVIPLTRIRAMLAMHRRASNVDDD
jgi:Fe-S-cluster containining protein